LRRANGRADNFADDVRRSRAEIGGGAAADGGKKGNFVAGAEHNAPLGKFFVHRGDERRPKGSQRGKLAAVSGEEVFEDGTIVELRPVFGAAGDVLQTPKEKNANAHRSDCSAARDALTSVYAEFEAAETYTSADGSEKRDQQRAGEILT
jgi:hypothetical protein